ncbi:hypothetical protein D3C80_1929630 [compost metagenome]
MRPVIAGNVEGLHKATKCDFIGIKFRCENCHALTCNGCCRFKCLCTEAAAWPVVQRRIAHACLMEPLFPPWVAGVYQP